MPDVKKPEIIVFAGPNGSGKSTITQFAKVIEPYINADEIKNLKQSVVPVLDTTEKITDRYVKSIVI